MVYVSPDADGFFLSLEAMLDLGLINRGSELCPSELSGQVSSHSIQSTGSVDQSEPDATQVKCTCPMRTPGHSRPSALPFPVVSQDDDQ